MVILRQADHKIFLDYLLISQEVLRNPEQLPEMVAHVRSGQTWNKLHDGKLIAITMFPTYLCMIHDGHHRIVANLLAERRFLDDDEYVLTERKFEDYLSPNLKTGWLTPFHPIHEVRLPDWTAFKREVNLLDDAEKVAFILKNKNRYAVRRKMYNIEELVERYAII